ncbi:peptide ligase PGM1-related protein [Knoellia locipacati]|uniref:peptide ligase PGM1-related protein n=1 Tax=Knoellia locipacati TaxID=882824 RepID=UPI00384B2599
MDAFRRLQERLPAVLALNDLGGTASHVVVALPSFSMGETLLSHYATRLPAMEHRYLLAALLVGRIPGAKFLLVTCGAADDVVLDYYARLASGDASGRSDGVRRRISTLVVPDDTPRGVAAKLLDRPDLLDELRARIGDRPAFIEPWNVTTDEVEVALALDAPVNGTHPDLWPLGFKSAGRRLFHEAGVPTPAGAEDVHDAAEIAQAVALIRRSRPRLDRVVVKQDNSGAGDGNRVVSTRDASGHRLSRRTLGEQALVGASPTFAVDLAAGGVVEELVAGSTVTSPSVQLDLRPDGDVRVVATHEQMLGGDNGQVFVGSRFPADPAYADVLARHGQAVGRLLAEAGAVGRVAIDFVALRRAGAWQVFALELNLRKGGTTYPYAALRHLAPGHYDVQAGRWRADSGGERCYRAGDAVLDPAWLGMPPEQAIDAVDAAGLAFDPARGTGVVLHMLGGLAIDGRVGVVAIGGTRQEAETLYAAVPAALHRTVRR